MRVLTLFNARFEQRARFVQHIANGARDQVTPHAGDDAKAAAVVTAFADLQVSVMARRELDAGDATRLGHQVDERVMGLGHVQVHRVHHLLGGMGAGHGQHLGVDLADQVVAAVARAGAQAAGHDDLAVFGQGLANGVQAFFDSVVDETTGVHDDQVGALVLLAGFIAFGAQLREDQL